MGKKQRSCSMLGTIFKINDVFFQMQTQVLVPQK